MPIGKEIYKQIGKRFGERHQRMAELGKQGPEVPPTVQQAIKNKTSLSKSDNLHITELAQVRRNISPTEGKPAVNGSADAEKIEKIVGKPKGPKSPRAGSAAIKGKTKKKKPK